MTVQHDPNNHKVGRAKISCSAQISAAEIILRLIFAENLLQCLIYSLHRDDGLFGGVAVLGAEFIIHHHR